MNEQRAGGSPRRGALGADHGRLAGRGPGAEPLTPDELDAMKRAAAQFLNDSYEMLTGTGAHAEHEQSQVGRCVYCSCGMRVQGRLSRD